MCERVQDDLRTDPEMTQLRTGVGKDCFHACDRVHNLWLIRNHYNVMATIYQAMTR